MQTLSQDRRPRPRHRTRSTGHRAAPAPGSPGRLQHGNALCPSCTVYSMAMAAEQQHPQPALSKAELRARLVGDALEHEREDIRFWQAANERERGEALYEL